MPASSQGLPTSAIARARPPQEAHAIFTASIHGRCGEWPSNSSQPATARSRSSSREPMTSKAPQAAHSQIGSASP